MYLLVTINIVIILLDIGLLSIEYASLLILETILKGVFYSIKLKLEFAILGRLVSFVRSGQTDAVECVSSNTGTSSFSGQRTQTSQTRSIEPELEEGHSRHLESMSPTRDTCVPRRPPQLQGSSGSQIPFKEMIAEQ
jgi:hypothetical protein